MLVFAVATVTLAIVGFALVLASVKAHWHESRQCSNCQYDLTGHERGGVCPECGRVILEFADGTVERRPWLFIMGMMTMLLAILTFALFTASLIGWRFTP